MRFSLVIDCDNDAFGPDSSRPERVTHTMRSHLKRLIYNVHEHLSQGAGQGAIQDANGNIVGQWELKKRP